MYSEVSLEESVDEEHKLDGNLLDKPTREVFFETLIFNSNDILINTNSYVYKSESSTRAMMFEN